MNPLDTLIDQLGGPAAVAEMTGRKGRLVRSKSTAGVVYQLRNAEGVAAGEGVRGPGYRGWRSLGPAQQRMVCAP